MLREWQADLPCINVLEVLREFDDHADEECDYGGTHRPSFRYAEAKLRAVLGWHHLNITNPAGDSVVPDDPQDDDLPDDAHAEDTTPGTKGGDTPGVFAELGALPAAALVTEEGLAGILGKCKASIKAAVNRGELPRPSRLMGKNTWTAGSIIRHHESRLEAEAKRFRYKP